MGDFHKYTFRTLLWEKKAAIAKNAALKLELRGAESYRCWGKYQATQKGLAYGKGVSFGSYFYSSIIYRIMVLHFLLVTSLIPP